ncbi:hypothetical protein CLV98_101616 [Dyadobacter jejuensis]|uniref:Uncharacterized protein n=1 Tax=Dyadobacter jejuensis TaxID=1082580 RepID=A0A316AS56_9BACT|nr:hypothetical protein [Dyadobacter jejuensis]PWJ60432.1 hypothetical protein CLV98_101616 [Dyadobacter jejuensis]
MKQSLLIALTLGMASPSFSQSTSPSTEVQIATAILAAPADLRDGAKVYGISSDGTYKVLRAGSNELVCIADDASKDGISVACYHKSLQPFMERGWKLKQEGKNAKEVFDIREKEVKEGKLKMPDQPTTLFALSGKQDQYDSATGALKDGYLRYVVYIPYATSETTGLPLKPDVPGMPWIMDPGTHRAHIMINPAKN